MSKAKTTAATVKRGGDYTIGDQVVRRGGLPSAAERSSATTAKKRAAEAAGVHHPGSVVKSGPARLPTARETAANPVGALHAILDAGRPRVVSDEDTANARKGSPNHVDTLRASSVLAAGSVKEQRAAAGRLAKQLEQSGAAERAARPQPVGNSFVTPIVTPAEERAAKLAAAKLAAAAPVRKTHSASELSAAIAANNKRAVDAMAAAGVKAPTAGKPSTVSGAQLTKIAAALKPAAAVKQPAVTALCSKCGRDNRRPAATADCRNAGACSGRAAALKAAVTPAAAAVSSVSAVKPVAAVSKPAKTAKRK